MISCSSHVAVVRAFVVAPAHVQPHLLGRDVEERRVDRVDHAIDEREEVGERPSAKVLCRSLARSGQSSCSRKPASTIALYSTRSASPSAARNASSLG